MRILITNDDGAGAHGLSVLHQIAKAITDDVWIVAPERNQSGSSHSLTFEVPLRYREIGERAYAVRGTPADCVIMGVRRVLKDKRPDLILSGVNHGANLAEDVTYSGTVGGAREGALVGIPSIAMSLTIGFDPEGRQHWKTPLELGPGLVRKLVEAGWPQGVLMNINFPDQPAEKVRGVVVTSQGRRDIGGFSIEERRDTYGEPYFWYGFGRRRTDPPEGTDLWAIKNAMVSVTPLSLDLTHRPTRDTLADHFKSVTGRRLKGSA
jgi:5'-nucleotidase